MMKDKLMASLLDSLEENPSMSERDLLDNFISTQSSKYTFPPFYSDLIERLFSCRLIFDQFTFSSDFYSYILKILQSLRILTRDQSISVILTQNAVLACGGVEVLGKLIKEYSKQHFQDPNAKYLSEILVELATIIRRLSENDAICAQMSSFEIPEVLSYTLGSYHAIVTRASLEALISLSRR
jgi:hypothetical protein